MDWIFLVLFGIGMTVIFIFLTNIIAFFTADENHVSGRRGDERQHLIRRTAVIGSWASILYYTILKVVTNLPVIANLVPKRTGGLLNPEIKNALMLDKGLDILLVAIVAYIVFYFYSRNKVSA